MGPTQPPPYHNRALNLGRKVDIVMNGGSQTSKLPQPEVEPWKTSLTREHWCQILNMREQANMPVWQRGAKTLRQGLRDPSLSSQGGGASAPRNPALIAWLPHCGFPWVHIYRSPFQKDHEFPGAGSMFPTNCPLLITWHSAESGGRSLT